MNKAIEAITTGLKDSGIGFVSNFPGSKSEIFFTELGGKTISLNEKIAYEEAYGASLAGKRSVVTMKNVGLSVAADPFLNSIISGVNAGLVMILVDDLEVRSSQSRQDSRHFLDFFGGLWFEPTNIKEAYDLAYQVFEISEELDTPVVIRLTNKFFNLDGIFERSVPKKKLFIPANNPEKFIVHPTYWVKQYKNLKLKNKKIEEFVEKYNQQFNKKFETTSEGRVVIGNCTDELKNSGIKHGDQLNIHTYPLPVSLLGEFFEDKENIEIYEQGDDYATHIIKSKFCNTNPKIKIQSDTGSIPDLSKTYRVWKSLEKLFQSIKNIEPSYVVSDLTQFTRESTNTIRSCLCLGASVSTAIGLSEGGIDYPFCVVGDTSFQHGGLLSLYEAVARDSKFCIVIIDNNGSWCTGGQNTVFDTNNISIDIPKINIDFKNIRLEELTETLHKIKEKKMLSMIIIKCTDTD